MTSTSTASTSATPSSVTKPSRTSVYQHEEAIANEFGRVIQKRKTLVGNKSALSFRDKLFILRNAETTDALYLGLAAGLGAFWVAGRLRGARQLPMPTSPFRKEQSSFPFVSPRTLRGIDALFSTWLGFQVSLWSLDTMEKQRIISKIPLQPGRSGVSEALCGVLVNEYKRQWKLDVANTTTTHLGTSNTPELSRRQTLKQPHRQDLQALFRFIENCEKRQAVEQRVRSEQGLRPEQPVAVPAPGVVQQEVEVNREQQWSTEDVFACVGDQGDSSTRM